MPKLGWGPMKPASSFVFSAARPFRRADLRIDEAAGDGAFLTTAYLLLRSRLDVGHLATEGLLGGGVSAPSQCFHGLGLTEEVQRLHGRLDQVCTSLAWLRESFTTLLTHPFFGLTSMSGTQARHALFVSVEGRFAVLNRKQYPITEGQALVLQVLLENEGHFVSSMDTAKLHPILNARDIPKRVIKELPEPIRNLIQSKRGAGFRLVLSK